MTDEKTSFLIEDLDADTEYIFRVAAINKYGTGEFAEFPVAHTSVEPEESEEIPQTPEKVDEEKELTEPKKPKAKKAVKKDGSEKTERLEEEVEHAVSEVVEEDASQAKLAAEKEIEIMDFNETAKEFEVGKVEEETVTRVTRPENEIKDEVPAMDKEKVGRLDSVEAEERKPKKTKRKKTAKEEKPSEEVAPIAQHKSVEAVEHLVEEKILEAGKKTIEDFAEHIDGKILLEEEKAVSEEMKYVNELDRNTAEREGEYAEETVPLIIEEKKFEEKLSKKVSQEEKKSAEIATEFEVRENLEIKREKKKEVDVGEVSELVKLDKKVGEVVLEEESTVKEMKEIKKKKSSKEKSRKTAAKKAEEPVIAVKVADESFDIQLQKQDIIVEEITTSEKVKIEAEKEEIKKDNLEEKFVEDKSKVKKKKEQREEKRKKIDELVSIDVFFENTSNLENVDKIIATLGSKDVISISVKAASKKNKSKMSKKLIKEKSEEMVETQQEKAKAEKLEAKLDVDKVEIPERGKEKDGDVSKRLDSGQEDEEQKSVEDKEGKPKKKATGKKVAKKALLKPKAEEETAKKSMDEDAKIADEVQEVHVEEKHAEEDKVNEFKDEKVEKLESDADIDVSINIPAVPISEITEPEDSIGTIPLLRKDETPITRRVHKRSRGFALPPDQEILAFRNDTVKIECELFNKEDEINWTINGKPATDDIRCTEIVDGYLRILQIENVVPEDTGVIVTANLHEHSAESCLVIEDVPVEIIEKLPRKITGKMDGFVKLSITVSYPTENCQWFFNNEQLIENNDHYEIKVEGNVYSLLMKNLAYDQAGRYSVKVDSAETSTILTVEGAPVLHETETTVRTIDLESQDNLVLSIPFKAIPEPTLECFFNNEKIPSSSKIKLDIFNDKVCFCKRKMNKSDAGEYTIKIKNDYGEVSQTFSVNIKGHFFFFKSKIKLVFIRTVYL